MKYSDSGDYCMLYLESGDDKNALFNVIARQQKQVVIIPAEHVPILQRPEDFVALKHFKRQRAVGIIFVIEGNERLAQLASRHGFPVYSSIEALSDALLLGHLGRLRALNRTTSSLSGPLQYPQADRESKPHQALPRPPVQSAEHTNKSKISHGHISGVRCIIPKQTLPLNSLQGERRVPRTVPLLERIPLETEREGVNMPKTGPLPEQSSLTNVLPAKTAYPQSNEHPAEVPQWKRPSSVPAQQSQQDVSPALLTTKQRRSHFSLAIAVLVMLSITLAGLGAELIFFNKMPTGVAAAPSTVGQIRFLSSGQISENSSQGINDQVVVDLNNLSNPASGKSYYGWLLGDKNQADLTAVLLGTLSLSNGHAHLLYKGDAQHTNLLLITSRFLVTEEDAAITPVSPSPDISTWRYYGAFMQTPDKRDPWHFSYLDHLRHLLASDPALDDLELLGGQNSWFYRNSAKILEWSSSMRESWEDTKDVGFVRRMAIRTLTYLDGLAFVQQDLPPNTPLLVNERLARIGLLNIAGPNQDPADYILRIDTHLNGLLLASSTTPELRKQVASIVAQLDGVKSWLAEVRHDALLIMKMSDQQLRLPPTLDLINDMIANANYAYTGQTDPNTGQVRQGAVWIHEHIQELAVLDIAKFTPATRSALGLIHDTTHMKVFY